MIRTRRSPYKRMITDINITPFTDVCLVLLIIFMVTATALTKETNMRLNLPKAVTADSPLPASVTVKINHDQQMYLNYDQFSSQVTFAELETRLRELRTEHGARLLVVKADEGVPYRLVISAIDTARKVGLDQIALATREPETRQPVAKKTLQP